jgi:GPH family glycoside/pentoside/hexuronide:cation symporter
MKANFESLQALASSSYILSFAGYVNPNDEPGAKDNQPDSAIMALRIMLGAIPAALLGFSYLLVWFYPLTKEKVDEIQIKLTEMRRRK